MTAPDEGRTFTEWALLAGPMALPYPSEAAARAAYATEPGTRLVRREVSIGPWADVPKCEYQPGDAVQWSGTPASVVVDGGAAGVSVRLGNGAIVVTERRNLSAVPE
jgi:hypothetical protein